MMMNLPNRAIKRTQAGFTLIELMIVIAIIGILAAIAVPAYQDYSDRAKFAEVIGAASPLKSAIASCVQKTGSLAGCDNGANGVPAAFTAASSDPGYVASTSVTNGVVTVTSQNISGTDRTYTLTPTVQTGGHITWAQGGTCTAVGFC